MDGFIEMKGVFTVEEEVLGAEAISAVTAFSTFFAVKYTGGEATGADVGQKHMACSVTALLNMGFAFWIDLAVSLELRWAFRFFSFVESSF